MQRSRGVGPSQRGEGGRGGRHLLWNVRRLAAELSKESAMTDFHALLLQAQLHRHWGRSSAIERLGDASRGRLSHL
jgi:hypothetical protein